MFYSGCVILEVRDYRRSITGSYDTQYVLLKPTSQVSDYGTQYRLLFGLRYKFTDIYIEFWTWVQAAVSPWQKHVYYKVYDISYVISWAFIALLLCCCIHYVLWCILCKSLSPCSLCCLICTTSSMTGAIDGHRRTSLLWRVSYYWRQLNPSVWTPPRQSCLWTTNCSTNRKCCVIPSWKGQNQILNKAYGLDVIKRPLL